MSNTDDATRTQVDAALAAAQRRFANDPTRAEIIARTRRFKSSWIELAEALVDCRQSERYKKWSYNSFEDYYRKELHLKPGTVDKLVGSYAFLRRSAPQVLDRDGVEQEIPSFQTIDFLRKAEEAAQSGHASKETVEEVRKAVVDDNMPLPKVTRLFKESLFPTDQGVEVRKRQKEVGKLARKLSELLGAIGEGLPPVVRSQVEQALAALLRALPDDSAEEPASDKKAA